ncbi:tRNA-(ms[2]io[6]A)-hydroxylase [Acanthopleuribacter pedis]|uniref:tRNA-(Ms[2]io[6]A)-hydroxylase n=1 Tax=Acanthopleuribacter pedis TaxID=442870 RepID=A0A8J7QLD5_9BACT|nr:tRNA-(ms[2]io[6]A)-hydroxylase [Acanthopleuribacter pedis]MBO1320110.1 tRNA-(ms[2]io[6]A)-hydroxylase [Acanthopleuribacter pedis]
MVIPDLEEFLLCATPQAWVDCALKQQETMLIDHANCEKKAASTALNLMFRYIDRPELLTKMSRLAREELRHFEQVLAIMEDRDIRYTHVSASRYAEGLRVHMRKQEPGKLIDVLIVGAIIEARSCERFRVIAPHLDETLSKFYTSLLRSERRHFADYLKLAYQYAGEDISERVTFFLEKERELVLGPDETFRFHSGIPA